MRKQDKIHTTIYYIDTIDINLLVDKHKELLSIQQTKLNETILAAKYEFLIHIICMRYHNNKFGAINLNTKVLQKIFQTTYKTMLEVLINQHIIFINNYYQPGVTCRLITLYDSYINHIKKKQPENLLEYNKLDKICTDTLTSENKKRKDNDIVRIAEETPEASNLLDTYDKYLKNLRITDKEEFNNYLQSKCFHSDKQKEYYDYIANQYINGYKTFNHKAIDDNNRIYSILTLTPRYIKNFLNIKYSIDIKNSHPLLFNYFIINNFNISISLLNSFYKYISSLDKSIFNKINITHNTNIGNNSTDNNNTNSIQSTTIYVIENIRNSICTNRKQLNEFARIPYDIWLYILRTSTGRFWDDFKDNFIEYGLNRTDVKQTIFHEVFYSHSLSVHGKMFAQAFKEVYPNVYDLITKMKLERINAPYEAMREFENFTEKMVAKLLCVFEGKTKHISNDMMKLESNIFFEILEKLYARRDCKALIIHDAIIVLDTNSKKECKKETIENIMRNVYKKYNLLPQFSTDKYNPLKWHEDLKKEKENQPLIEAIIKEIEEDAAKGKKLAIETLKLINDGEIEIVVEDDNTLQFHRLFKHSTRRKVKGTIDSGDTKGVVTKKYKQIQKASKKYLKN